jgi:hypothetical protein
MKALNNFMLAKKYPIVFAGYRLKDIVFINRP